MSRYRVRVESRVDAITNSSSELYVIPATGHTEAELRGMLLDLYADLLTSDDEEGDEVRSYLGAALHPETATVIVRNEAGEEISRGTEDSVTLDRDMLEDLVGSYMSVQYNRGVAIIQTVEEIYFPRSVSSFIQNVLGGIEFE